MFQKAKKKIKNHWQIILQCKPLFQPPVPPWSRDGGGTWWAKTRYIGFRMSFRKIHLLFHDIPNMNSEDCKQTVRQFMCDNMHVRKEINIQREHWVRRNLTSSNVPPRNIVAKFSYFKDRELVKKQAPKKMKVTDYIKDEQFPAKVDQHRSAVFQ